MRKMIGTIMALAMIMAMATPIYASHYSDQKLMVVSEQVFMILQMKEQNLLIKV